VDEGFFLCNWRLYFSIIDVLFFILGRTNFFLPLLLEDQSFKESFCCQDITTYSLPVEARIFTGFFFFRERLGMNAGWSGFLLDFRIYIYIGRFPFW